MTETYITQRERLHTVASLVDLRHPPTQNDIQMYEFLKYYDLPVITVAARTDKIPRGKWSKHESVIRKALNPSKQNDLIVFSSETKKGGEAAWTTVEKSL